MNVEGMNCTEEASVVKSKASWRKEENILCGVNPDAAIRSLEILC